MTAGFFDGIGKAPGGVDGGRAHVDNDGAFFHAVNHAILAKQHVFKGFGIGDTDDDDICIRRRIGRVGAVATPRSSKALSVSGLRVLTVRIALLFEIERHRTAHQSQTDECDVFPGKCGHNGVPSFWPTCGPSM